MRVFVVRGGVSPLCGRFYWLAPQIHISQPWTTTLRNFVQAGRVSISYMTWHDSPWIGGLLYARVRLFTIRIGTEFFGPSWQPLRVRALVARLALVDFVNGDLEEYLPNPLYIEFIYRLILQKTQRNTYSPRSRSQRHSSTNCMVHIGGISPLFGEHAVVMSKYAHFVWNKYEWHTHFNTFTNTVSLQGHDSQTAYQHC